MGLLEWWPRDVLTGIRFDVLNILFAYMDVPLFIYSALRLPPRKIVDVYAMGYGNEERAQNQADLSSLSQFDRQTSQEFPLGR